MVKACFLEKAETTGELVAERGTSQAPGWSADETVISVVVAVMAVVVERLEEG